MAWDVQISETMKRTTNKATLASIIESTYGVNPVQCDPIVIQWGADKALESGSTAGDVAKQWKAINGRRSRLGIYAPIPQYGHPCFAAY